MMMRLAVFPLSAMAMATLGDSEKRMPRGCRLEGGRERGRALGLLCKGQWDR